MIAEQAAAQVKRPYLTTPNYFRRERPAKITKARLCLSCDLHGEPKAQAFSERLEAGSTPIRRLRAHFAQCDRMRACEGRARCRL